MRNGVSLGGDVGGGGGGGGGGVVPINTMVEFLDDLE